MKITVKTLKGAHFDLTVEGSDSIVSVKRQIEEQLGKDGSFPYEQQLLIHQGKVLKDETTLADNNVNENGFIVVMTTKPKSSQPAPTPAPPAPAPAAPSVPLPAAPQAPIPQATPESATTSAFAPPAASPPISSPTPAPVEPASNEPPADAYGTAASSLVAGSHLESVVQQIMDIGGDAWDREIVLRALRAAYNNPERAVEYLYSGIPETAEPAPPVARGPPGATPAPVAGAGLAPGAAASPVPAPAPEGPNAAPLDLFPQGMPGMAGGAGGAGSGALDFLRSNAQFQALRTMVQANPQILQPMLQELGKQNPQLLQLINSNQQEFLRLINEDIGEAQGDPLAQLGGAVPQHINVSNEEKEAIDRLEGMGFDRALVIEAFFACDKDEQLAANYLLEHLGDYED